jgi:hypothetical protein
MATNRDLLKEAIADAKAVKDAAITNAKVALEEAFTPYLKEKFAAKLAEIEEEEMEEGMETEGYEKDSMEERLGTINDPSEEGVGNAFSVAPHGNLEEEDDTMEEELDLEALLRELEGEGITEGEEDLINNPGGAGNLPKQQDMIEEEDEEEMGEEEISIEDMSEEDLKKFIEDVIADMVEAGELEAGHEGMEDEEGEEEMMDEEVNLEELMADITERKKYGGNKGDVPASKRGDRKDTAKEEGVEDYKKKLKEAYNTIEEMKKTLNEINLLNAKLLYTNKIFKSKSLTESQKVKVLAAFDKATSKKEAQLVYETLLEGFQQKKSSITESKLGSASKVIGNPAPKQPIIEVNNQFTRWQKLAGIK